MEENKNKSISSYIWLVVRIILYIVLALIILAFIVGIRPYSVITGSMYPSIKINDIILVDTSVKKDSLEVGDIVTFRVTDNMIITHRIIEVTTDGEGNLVYIQQGDSTADSSATQIKPSQVIGKVLTINGKPVKFDGLGSFIKFLQKNIILVVLLIVGIFVIINVLGGLKEQRHEIRDEHQGVNSGNGGAVEGEIIINSEDIDNENTRINKDSAESSNASSAVEDIEKQINTTNSKK